MKFNGGTRSLGTDCGSSSPSTRTEAPNTLEGGANPTLDGEAAWGTFAGNDSRNDCARPAIDNWDPVSGA